MKNELESIKAQIKQIEEENEETLKKDLETQQQKLEKKFKREMEILNEKIYIKDKQIEDLQKICQNSQGQFLSSPTKDGEDISSISEKIRSEYIAAIETLQTNLENLKLKYQNEVSGRKDDNLAYKESIRDYKRKIKILESEKGMHNLLIMLFRLFKWKPY